MRKLLALAFLGCAVSSGAHAGQYTAYIRDNLPPAKWQARVNAAPLTGYLAVSAAELKRRCKVRDSLLGCNAGLKGFTIIYVWDGLRGRDLDMVLMHERAHEKGWHHD